AAGEVFAREVVGKGPAFFTPRGELFATLGDEVVFVLLRSGLIGHGGKGKGWAASGRKVADFRMARRARANRRARLPRRRRGENGGFGDAVRASAVAEARF